MKSISTSLLLVILAVPAAHAEGQQGPLLDRNKFSIGAGVARNSVDTRFGDYHDTGFQFFGAYDLTRVNLMAGVDTSLEFGYMDYGFDSGNDDGGLWVTGVVDGSINSGLGWLARLGLDLGDDSGLMFGAGIGIKADPKLQLRFEYVIRDDIDSLQMNFIYHL